MLKVCGMVVLGLGLCAGCASRSTNQPATTPRAAPTTSAQAPAQMTPQDLQARMKNIGPTSASLRMHLMNGMTAEAAKEAQQMAFWFGDVERFWLENKKADAAKFAATARMYATEAAGAATAGDAMKASMAANNMQGMCKQCHGMYREADPNGGFRIKPGVIPGV